MVPRKKVFPKPNYKIMNIPSLLCPTDFDLILVIGGLEFNPTPVELVSLDPDNHPVPSCLGNLTDFPIFGLRCSAGAVDEEGNPFICGGQTRYNNDSPTEFYEQCYKYYPKTDSWEEVGSMSYSYCGVSDIEVPGLGLVMVGGLDIEGGCPSCVTATTDGISFQSLAPLPADAGSIEGRGG